jgi:hypothetical protein
MIVNDLHVIGISVEPNKTQTPLIVDPNTVLPFPVAAQCFQTISGRRCQVAQFRGTIQLAKLSPCNRLDRPKPSTAPPVVKPFTLRISESLDHR